MPHPDTGERGVWMDEDTYNWYYGGVEYAFICDEGLRECYALAEQQQKVIEEETNARYQAERDAERQRNQKWIFTGAGLLLGILGGFAVAN